MTDGPHAGEPPGGSPRADPPGAPFPPHGGASHDHPAYDSRGRDRQTYDDPGYVGQAYDGSEYDRPEYDRTEYDRPAYERPDYERTAYQERQDDDPSMLRARREPATRRRHWRQSLTFLFVLMLVLGAGVVGYGQFVGWWTLGGVTRAAAGKPCPVRNFADPSTVRIRVYNSTKRVGLARAVARQLQARGFTVTAVANDTSRVTVHGVATLRHSTKGVRAARSVRAQLEGAVVDRIDNRGNTDLVDIVIGNAFHGLTSAAKAKAAIPPLPDGCVPATASG